ncbi:hypothetical protein QIW31_04945 [Francisellaceae bacterium CB299]
MKTLIPIPIQIGIIISKSFIPNLILWYTGNSNSYWQISKG